MLDLDGFKRVNDTYGHAGGDELLIEVARRLRLAFRASDLVARVGGDEFTLLLPDWPDTDSLELDLRRRLRQVLERPFRVGAAEVQVRFSLGWRSRRCTRGPWTRCCTSRTARCTSPSGPGERAPQSGAGRADRMTGGPLRASADLSAWIRSSLKCV